jgi:hypothetical protein
MKKTILSLTLIFLLAACAPVDPAAPGQTDPPEPAYPAGESPPAILPAYPVPTLDPSRLPAAIEIVRQYVIAANGYPDDAVQVVSYEALTFPDSCLGVNRTEEMCLQVITPGFRILLYTPDGEVWVHTDEDGANIRYADATPPQTVSPDS